MEIVGLAWAKTFQEITYTVVSAIHIYFFSKEAKEALYWPTREVFNELGEFMKLGIPMLIIYSLFWFCFELYILLAGAFGPSSQAAVSIFVTFLYIHDIKRDAICQAACSQVGNFIGSMQTGLAERCHKLIVWTEVFINIVIILLLTTFRN